MAQLFFKKPLQTAILEGRKSSTIRRWNRPRVRAGEQAFAPGVGWLAIETVERVELDGLSDDDARADGFDTYSQLLALLRECYPDAEADGKEWFRVRFHLKESEARGQEGWGEAAARPASLFPPAG